jgi:hypothetical protein
MLRKLSVLVISFGLFLIMPVFSASVHAIPPKPGPDFVWVDEHRTPDGTIIEGHWKYIGPNTPGKTWIPGHRERNGEWIPGHWKDIPRPKKGGVWVPGHYGPKGRWIPGHWK